MYHLNCRFLREMASGEDEQMQQRSGAFWKSVERFHTVVSDFAERITLENALKKMLVVNKCIYC